MEEQKQSASVRIVKDIKRKTRKRYLHNQLS